MSLADTLFVGQGILRFAETNSTNQFLKETIQGRSIPEGFTLNTQYQKSGRGQTGEYWESSPGLNLLQSTFFKPQFLPARYAFALSMSVCLALRDMSRELGLSTLVKWPNDLLLPGGGKIAGVLIENQIAGKYLEGSIVGIGLNVNQKEFTFRQASSLSLATGKDWPLSQVEKVLLERLEHRYLQLRENYRNPAVKKDYLENLYGYHRAVPVQDLRKKKGQMQIIDVHPDGTLVGLWEDGSQDEYRFKELRFLRNA